MAGGGVNGLAIVAVINPRYPPGRNVFPGWALGGGAASESEYREGAS